MKRVTAIILTPILLVLLATGVNIALGPEEKQSQPVIADTAPKLETLDDLRADKIYALVNEERMKTGIHPLIRHSELDASAAKKSQDMWQDKYFGHGNPTTGFRGVHYVPEGLCSTWGENISEYKYQVADANFSIVDSWMNSKLHHDAILDPKYTHAGLAVVGDKITQHFCVAN